MAAPGGYVGFGSFHSENVEVMVAQTDESYQPPPLPFAVDDLFDALERAPLELGASARPQFLVDFQRWTFLNHGAFGACSAATFEAAHRWRRHCEAQPLLHIDRLLFPHIVLATRLVAAHLRVRPVDLVFAPNATSALNAVVFSAPLAPGDAVYSLNVGYGSVKKMLQLAAGRSGAELVEAQLRFPLAGAAAVLELVRRTLPGNAKLAVFDAVTSNTGLCLPVAELAALVRSLCPACRVLVDGAHALGSQELDVPALGVHYWVSNCHKHLCSPRGCAVLWAAPEVQHGLRPPVVSHGAGAGFTSDFIWDGCRDYSPVLVLPQTLRWWAAIGQPRALAYMRATLAQGVAILLARWQTHTLAPLELCGNMALVRLPHAAPLVGFERADIQELLARQPPAEDGCATSADAKQWQDWLFERAVEVPVKSIQGYLYVRISCHIYNVTDDYEVLASVVAQRM